LQGAVRGSSGRADAHGSVAGSGASANPGHVPRGCRHRGGDGKERMDQTLPKWMSKPRWFCALSLRSEHWSVSVLRPLSSDHLHDAGWALMRRMFGVHALNYSQYPVMTPLRTWSTVKVAGFCTPSAGSDQDLTNKMHFGDSVVCTQSNAAFSCALGQGKSPSY